MHMLPSEQYEVHGMRPVCFKCEKPIQPAVVPQDDEDYWDLPQGVVFHGGHNYGSSHFDSLVDGVCAHIVICDDCIGEHKSNPEMIRLVQGPRDLPMPKEDDDEDTGSCL